jgi:penicillin-binding protein 2
MLSTTWFAGIGQGQVLATPIQMADVAATIARDGLWIRPSIVMDQRKLLPSTQPVVNERKIEIAPEALAAAHYGMKQVVYGAAATGDAAQVEGIQLAGKTGTAQAPKFRIPLRDAQGKPALDAEGNKIWQPIKPTTWIDSNPQAPWYRAMDDEGKNFNHGWFIAYAPADHPQIAVAVLVEYGGAGGTSARMAGKIIAACMAHGYLSASSKVASRE